MYIFAPSIHQDSYQKLINCFSNYIPISFFQNKVNEKCIVSVFDDRVNHEDFQKPNTHREREGEREI